MQGERTIRRGRPPIGGQDRDGASYRCSASYTLLPLRGISPQGETRNLRRKTERHILHVPLRHSPFGGWRHHLPPAEWWDYGCLAMEPCLCRKASKPILPPLAGEVRRSRIGGGERSEPVSRMPIMPYDTESKSRNADFILIALRAIPQPSARRAVKLKNPPAVRPVNPKNPHTEGVSTGASRVPCAILSGLLYN